MSRIFCVGRNYINHALELGNLAPTEPIIFMKPLSSLVKNPHNIIYPKHGNELHYETELVIQIGKAGKPKNKAEVKKYISGFAIGLDLTLRDVQSKLKDKGYPWEISKSFDDSATITNIVDYQAKKHDLNNLNLKCYLNDIERQNGNF
jgi:2-keto-4-pentenoate hydratase/2-oxohepta-3-ene-1,7-dioic acid hydratase in catechol pathway